MGDLEKGNECSNPGNKAALEAPRPCKWCERQCYFSPPSCVLRLCLVLNGTDNRVTHTYTSADAPEGDGCVE